MRKLSEILQENTAHNPDEQYVLHAIRCSPFVQRLLTGDEALLPELMAQMHQAWTADAMRYWLDQQDIHDDISLKRALRKLRQRVILRLIVRDLNGLADLNEVIKVVSALAEVTLQHALHHLTPWLEAIYGIPMGEESGLRQEFIVVGMGKLGGHELNVSSDIDLIFAFEEDGETSGTKSVSNMDFFTRLAKRLIAAIDEITEDGFVFRVDMRLRPYGSEGPLACSFAMLEEYYQNQGREWERYAWIKGRVVAGQDQGLSDLLRPFVFRKYLDFGAFASMRDLKVQIQRDVNRRDMHDNIKLGRGGIREVEFIAQVFQLIRGGRDSSLQIKPTLSVLNLLQEKSLLPGTTVSELREAYIFLRNLEHRLQYMEDTQTQDIPQNAEGRARIALGMGFENWEEFHAALEQYRAKVQHHFDEVFTDPQETQSAEKSQDTNVAGLWQGLVTGQDAHDLMAKLGYAEPEDTLRKVMSFHGSPRYKQLPELSRQRFDALMPMAMSQAAQEPHPDVVLMRVADLLDSICRRASYLALLAEYPAALTLVIRIVGASPWLAQYLSQHPILLDELLDTRNLYAAPDFAAMHADLERRILDLHGDVERQMDEMRHFKHAAVFRFAAKDVAGELSLETLSDYLSALADIILDVTIKAIWQTLRNRHRELPLFAVIGYGKLGGKELGYASDLDIIFLYDDEVPEAGEVYAKLGQRINTWLSSMTSAGTLYETDMQLRPDGASGLLVSSVQAFRTYQQEKAWVWEHQALTRARFSAGSQQIGEVFEQIRQDVLAQPREVHKLRAEVTEMREKMHGVHPNHGDLFDLKHDRGGIVDVEFIVQYLVLAHAETYPELTRNLGNIALLEMLGQLGLVNMSHAQRAAQAYRDYRRRQHAIRLQGENKARVPLQEVSEDVEAVRALWQEVFVA
ncbi:bifunctional [glutamate--ammonia ligase]-adenylyl-L-tyrosine phosphorylase/[glutamate--ammonia-ligase] adenylyltransferase [Methylobacillus gramineus]|uniref:bifunctional [glutamate--ammonia ligase]-adenylyl-L-tyrosine phosphorylase/[glutamate--ammonia-ligase] adenylyltransferase n=1 Tax=Methylobacillus gramineus TaxID=755169 RepID=UPI001CFF95B4|nr:bifunctional [glutamate--ammonia ligase]-adenylyl-L-tyrosine phosphorylase/[glutamate--ammonia-ligase] adenylyltransferase [Methylobacillus gramineus]MCB5184574.1 bifunctional [glutamate--ammonia ligase]-adenylyl-L-tyrosine phosphorylase/[glutamate--ammonia-ligase] adenylyltransferase [Methylobacillus gramineus]